MCVALPGTVVSVNNREAVVDFSGNLVTARAGLVEVHPGDRVLVHAGCIIQKVSAADAEDLMNLMQQMGGQE